MNFSKSQDELDTAKENFKNCKNSKFFSCTGKRRKKGMGDGAVRVQADLKDDLEMAQN